MTIDRQALDKLREMVGGEEADLVEIVQSFLEEAPGLMQALQASAAGPDFVVLRRSAHSLKSNARDMGAAALAASCAALEQQAAASQLPAAEDLSRVQAELDAAVAELRSIFQLGGSA